MLKSLLVPASKTFLTVFSKSRGREIIAQFREKLGSLAKIINLLSENRQTRIEMPSIIVKKL
jgi:hypothetical protein